jgi:hypothetical protein
MNWYRKIASPALFDPKRLQAPKPNNKKIRFFNYLKSLNSSIEVYHGTSKKAWMASQQAGYLLSPKVRGAKDNEGRHKEDVKDQSSDIDLQRGMKQIFVTTVKEYADWYARSSGSMDHDGGVTLTIKLPLYALAEVQSAVFGKTGLYNEFSLKQRIEQVIDSDWKDELKAEFIKTEIGKKFRLGAIKANEITTLLALPTKWVVAVNETPKAIEEKSNNPFLANYGSPQTPKLFNDDIPDPPEFIDGKLVDSRYADDAA